MLAFSTTQLAKTMPSSPVDCAIMTIGKVADYLNVSELTINLLTGPKKILSFNVGWRWRFSKADIDCWIREQSSQPSSPENA